MRHQVCKDMLFQSSQVVCPSSSAIHLPGSELGGEKGEGLGHGQVGQVVTHLSRRLRAAFDMPASV